MSAPRLVSAVVINYEGGPHLLGCLESLLGDSVPVQAIVVDNGSEDGSTAAAVERFPEVEVVRPPVNLGFAGGANAGARSARGDLLLFLNPDVRLADGCLEALVAELEDPSVGVVSPAIALEASGELEYGSTIDVLGYPAGIRTSAAPLYVSGCALMTEAELFRAMGGFDDRYFMFVEDVDYCWRILLAGHDIRVRRDALAFHVGGASTPGGYITEDGLASTTFRIALRERNTLAMLCKYYALPSAALAVPAAVAQTLVTALALACAGSGRTAVELLAGVAWNVRHLPGTLERRRFAQERRTVPDREVRARMYRGLRKLDLLAEFGLPRVLDEPRDEGASRYARNRRRYGTHEVVLGLVPDGARVLDVGCASGYLGAALAERGCRIWGVDQDERALQGAGDAYEELLAVDLERIDELPWPEESFDVVVAADVLEHLRDPVAVLRLLERYLAPGGRLVVSLPNVANASVRLPLLFGRFAYTETGILDATHVRLYTFETARALLDSCGFRVERAFSGSNTFGYVLNRFPAARPLRGLLAYNIILSCTRPTSRS
jgi:2-polyprenyl-3-methyl-5-hydroxy-6-metoxy-1,4-benzoquinol methylase/glycosyltransferase involved in cell wall biosynthesis